LFSLIQSDNSRKNILLQSMHEGRQIAVKNALINNEDKINQLVKDYSGWDDLIENISNKDWLTKNVFTINTVFDLDYLWGFDAAGNIIFSNCHPKVKMVNIDFQFSKALFDQTPYVHYFVKTPHGDIVEISGAIIVPSLDIATRQSKPFGYLFLAKKLDSGYFTRLGSLTDSKVMLRKPKSENTIVIDRVLRDSKMSPVATLYFVKESALIKDWKKLEVIYFITTLGVVMSFSLLSFLFIHLWVSRPLEKVSLSLSTNDSSNLDEMKDRRDEFGQISNMIIKYFKMNEELNAEIECRKSIESKLQAYTIELKELSATKDKFLSLIAHDVANPLNNLVGFSELLAANSAKYDPEKIKKFTLVINHDAVTSAELLKNLLMWARAQSGKIIFLPEKFNVQQSIEEVVELFGSSALFRNINVVYQCDPDMFLTADRNMFCAIIRNLASNALKFTPSGGMININAYQDADYITIEVIDTGVGMTDVQLKSLFKTGNNSSTHGLRGEQGTGLGLVLCKEFTERHGGTFDVKSEVGKGSRFCVTLPKA